MVCPDSNAVPRQEPHRQWRRIFHGVAFRQFYRFALLPHIRRLTSHIRSAMTDGADELSRGEAHTVVFGGCDRATTCRVRQCNGIKTREERPVISSEPGCLLLRFKPAKFRERGPPRRDDRNLTSAETGIHRVTARAA